MKKCVKCGKPVLVGEYLVIDGKPVCISCTQDPSIAENGNLEITCPKCHKVMELGRVGIKVPLWPTGNIGASWFAFPYWYSVDQKPHWYNGEDIYAFSKDQDAFICKKCKVMTLL